MHYQFEAIHPLTDGNGRTGRVLNILHLIQEDLLALPILYLSRFIIAYKADYYRLLLAVTRERAGEPWVLFMLRAVEATAHRTTNKILAIRVLADAAAAHVEVRQSGRQAPTTRGAALHHGGRGGHPVCVAAAAPAAFKLQRTQPSSVR